MPPRTQFRYPLTYLIAVQIAVCAFLIWWRIPFTTTAHVGGGMFRQSTVRRGWDLQLYRHGTETVYHDNGQKYCEHVAYGVPYRAFNFTDRIIPGVRYWDRDGQELAGEAILIE